MTDDLGDNHNHNHNHHNNNHNNNHNNIHNNNIIRNEKCLIAVLKIWNS